MDSPTALKAAKWTTASMERDSKMVSRAVASQTLALRKEGSWSDKVRSRFRTSGELLDRSSRPTTSKPAERSASQVCEAI